ERARIREAGQVREVLARARDDGGEPMAVHVLMQARNVRDDLRLGHVLSSFAVSGVAFRSAIIDARTADAAIGRLGPRGNTVLRMPTFSFKPRPAEAKAIRAAARARGLSISEYLRRLALSRPARAARARSRLKRGRVVIAGAADAPTLTSADVAAAFYE